MCGKILKRGARLNRKKHICSDQNLPSTQRHRQGGRISLLTLKKMDGNGPRNIKAQR